MKNNKGFTLIEVLATISVLVIIISITLPSIINIKNNNIEKNSNKINEVILTATESYLYTYNYNIDDEANNKSCVQIEELLKKQLLVSNEQIEEMKNQYVQLSKSDDINYNITSTCMGAVLKYNEAENQNPSTPDIPEEKLKYKDTSGANPPELSEGMIPVTHNGSNWVVANIENEWYNYNKQQWANAVTTNSATYRTAKPGTVIPMSAINSMWVWIPRYKYRIPFQNIGVKYNNYFSNDNRKIYNALPGPIDIVFESKDDTTNNEYYEKIDKIIGRNLSTLAVNEYYTHPVFRNGTVNKKSTNYDQGGWDKELNGIWVGKFETGGNATTPLIKPNITSLTWQNTSTQISTAKQFMNSKSTYGLNNVDTHVMKNTEWGSVVYLAQSKYGKMGNTSYSGTNKEIYPNISYDINNNLSLITGKSSETNTCYSYYYSSVDANSQCGYTGTIGKLKESYVYDHAIGVNASTTGNIYGVYDMNGGAAERVMAGNGETYSKYFDKYNSGHIADTRILGDATWETRGWYKSQYTDRHNTIIPTTSEKNISLIRGSDSNNDNFWGWDSNNFRDMIKKGIFYYEFSDLATKYIGFRTVLIPNN